MNQAFLDYYRCPDSFADFKSAAAGGVGGRPSLPGDVYEPICNGTRQVKQRLESGASITGGQCLASVERSTCLLAFDPTEAANHLRYERYVEGVRKPGWKKLVREAYYAVRPGLPVSVRRHLQRAWLKGWEKRPFPRWPVDRTVDRMFESLMAVLLRTQGVCSIPFVWFWPEGKSSCAIMTHDVETGAGLAFAGELMDMDDSAGIKSSFQIIPESRYTTDRGTLSEIRQRGFEINVHDLRHDGHLFDDRNEFLPQAKRINEYAVKFGSKGFRSGVLYRKLDWYGSFDFSYDMSVPNVGHLDPQPGGCCTVMPFYVGDILELPLTTIQDYSLFNILGTYTIDIWRQQIDLIMQGHGLISFNIHPDYLDSERAKSTYRELLQELASLRTEAAVWTPLPGEVDSWWRQRSQMQVVPQGSGWKIEGSGSERARLAYAVLEEDSIRYSLTEDHRADHD